MKKRKLIPYLTAILVSLSVTGVTPSCAVEVPVNTTCCQDGYRLNYTLPMLGQCFEQEHPAYGLVQTIPKLIPARPVGRGCPRRQNILGIPPGQRICKIPDCLDNPCKNGWCEETMTAFVCHCSALYTGRNCETGLACFSDPCGNGATCVETLNGFTCKCSEGYIGDTCDSDDHILSVKLLGGNGSEGMIAFVSRSSPTTYRLIHPDNWNANSSQLVCQHLGFQGVYATVNSDYFNVSSVNTTEVAAMICPSDPIDITDCWYNDEMSDWNEETIAVVCCSVNRCSRLGSPVGLESGEVPDAAITASSVISDNASTKFARLNSVAAWIPSNKDTHPWLQVKLKSSYAITAIITQGRGNPYLDHRMTSYQVSTSTDGMTWTYYSYESTVKTFPGNYDRSTPVTHILEKAVICKFFRIHPKTNTSFMAVRLELSGYGPLSDVIAEMNNPSWIGCMPPIRGEPLGIEDGRIPDSSLTCSSSWHYISDAPRGRLNTVSEHVSGGLYSTGGWVPGSDDPDMWLKTDLGQDSLITGVILQGRYFHHHWVTSVYFSYSMDDLEWTFESGCSFQLVYAANFDRHTHVTILFPQPVTARYIRIHPNTWNGHPSLRYEVLGIYPQDE